MISFRGIKTLKEIPKKIIQKHQYLNYIFGNHQEEVPDRNMGVWRWNKTLGNGSNCNALLYGLPDYLIQRLQYVLNAAAKVITCKRKFDHDTPLLIELHWLPVSQRIAI